MTVPVIEGAGDSNVYTRTTVERPAPDEIRVAVAAAGVTPVDRETEGEPARFRSRLPGDRHCDVSGVADAVGYDVSAFEPGDGVYGMPSSPARQGTPADRVVDHTVERSPAPPNRPLFADAAPGPRHPFVRAGVPSRLRRPLPGRHRRSTRRDPVVGRASRLIRRVERSPGGRPRRPLSPPRCRTSPRDGRSERPRGRRARTSGRGSRRGSRPCRVSPARRTRRA